MGGRAAFVWRDDLVTYRPGPSHPLNPIRLEATADLLKTAGILTKGDVAGCRPCAVEDLLLVHDRRYIDAVRRWSARDEAALTSQERAEALAFGLGTADNPVFAGMHAAAALVAGASMAAADLVMTGQAQHAVSLAGGLHHALPDRAAGFCVYNDPAVAIAHLRYRYRARVAYVDIDAHHGDGVQWIFYEDPDVLTISIHESGHYLFPGTGHGHERGRGPGFGTSINIPLWPGTGDDSWIECFEAVVPRALRAFQPDVLISQHGCDAHRMDPLTHLAVSTRALARAAELLHQAAHELCEGRWIVLGGGGYDLLGVVPRAWTLLWAEVAGRPVDDELPEQWLARWKSKRPDIPKRLRDACGVPDGAEQKAATANRLMLERLLAELSLPV
ncbi:MAG: acetoin utilization protein AcuC [Firmicutes bacterium]|nr:acetoin utilization protein AcuC [Bacillota bacterium]